MLNKTLFILSSVVGLAICSRFSDLKLTTTKSTLSPGHLALAAAPTPCFCGSHSTCWWSEDQKTKHCACITGYIGDPPLCRPGPELWNLCFKVNTCGLYSECEVVNNATRCPFCISPYEGTPPNCQQPNACKTINCGPYSECNPHYASQCSCIQGFVGHPPNCTAGPALLALCDPYPCGGYAKCRIQDGRPVCTCRAGFEGTPPNCAPGPEMWRVCFKGKPCGDNSKCEMVGRRAVCSQCDEGYIGEPPYCHKTE